MRGEIIDLEPPRAQVGLGRLALTDKQELIEVDGDVFGVVERLKKIDPGLHLSFHKGDEVFVLQWKGLNDKGEFVEQFVGAYTELDARLVRLVERLAAREDRNLETLSQELERLERAKEMEQARRFSERVGPIGEQLAHAMRRDLGVKSRAYMSNGKKKR